MKYIIQLMLTMFPLAILAQDKGIRFEHGLNWVEVQAKAKEENKYIFMDCFTTWCGPCKMMSANVFPQEEVGAFFNKNFINVQVQMDTTVNDKEEIKKWYAEAKVISGLYGVKAFPTFLYFSPEGKLVHRVIGSMDARSFMKKSAVALTKQYAALLGIYRKKSGKTPAEIRNMAFTARENGDDKNADLFKSQYLGTQKDLYTKENLEFINAFTQSSKDKGFEMFLKNGDQVDEVMGAGTAIHKVNAIILKEDVVPRLPKDPGAAAPNWKAIKLVVSKKYPAYADEVISYAEVLYCPFMQDWVGFQQAIVPYMKKYGSKVIPEDLDTFAGIILNHGTDMKCMEEALEWSKRSFQDQENPKYINTYANLLYKMGKKQEAIAWQERAVTLANGDKKFQETLDRMKKGY